MDLKTEFSCGSENQDLCGFAFAEARMVDEEVQRREDESKSLAGTSLRNPHQISLFCKNWPGYRLDRHWLFELHLFQHLLCLFVEAELFKR